MKMFANMYMFLKKSIFLTFIIFLMSSNASFLSAAKSTAKKKGGKTFITMQQIENAIRKVDVIGEKIVSFLKDLEESAQTLYKDIKNKNAFATQLIDLFLEN